MRERAVPHDVPGGRAYAVDGHFVIAGIEEGWLPGRYDTLETAARAVRAPRPVLADLGSRISHVNGENRPITGADLDAVQGELLTGVAPLSPIGRWLDTDPRAAAVAAGKTYVYVTWGIRDPDGTVTAYGDQSNITSGQAITEAHPEGELVVRDVTVRVGGWRMPLPGDERVPAATAVPDEEAGPA